MNVYTYLLALNHRLTRCEHALCAASASASACNCNSDSNFNCSSGFSFGFGYGYDFVVCSVSLFLLAWRWPCLPLTCFVCLPPPPAPPRAPSDSDMHVKQPQIIACPPWRWHWRSLPLCRSAHCLRPAHTHTHTGTRKREILVPLCGFIGTVCHIPCAWAMNYESPWVAVNPRWLPHMLSEYIQATLRNTKRMQLNNFWQAKWAPKDYWWNWDGSQDMIGLPQSWLREVTDNRSFSVVDLKVKGRAWCLRETV